MSHKVKYTQKEYRQEYLKSDEWKQLRQTILGAKPNCQCCKMNEASDVHHLVYKNIVDIKVNTDLIPVCRTCHNFIHQAIRDGFIPKEGNLLNIKQKTISILENKSYDSFLKWAKQRHFLSEEEIKIIQDDRARSFAIRRISGLVKRKLDYDTIQDVKFTGRQIIKIRKILETTLWRQRQKSLKHPKFPSRHLPKGWKQRKKG